MSALEDDLIRTADRRLHRVATDDGGDVVAFLRNPGRWGHDLHAAHQRIRHLEARLRTTCPDHIACEHCAADYCEPCDIGDPAEPTRMCDHGRMLCVDCQGRCRDCAEEMRGEGL